jgi:hypothetical protein
MSCIVCNILLHSGLMTTRLGPSSGKVRQKCEGLNVQPGAAGFRVAATLSVCTHPADVCETMPNYVT